LIVDTRGQLWGAGSSRYGALGNGTVTEPPTEYRALIPITGSLTRWRSVHTKGFLSLGIDESGALWAWGKNDRGAVGNNSVIDQTYPVQIAGQTQWLQVSAGLDLAAAIDTDNQLFIWGDNATGQCSLTDYKTSNFVKTPQQVRYNGLRWQQVAVGRTHVLAVDTEGRLWTWGYGALGELGLGPTITSLVGQAQQITLPVSGYKIRILEAGDLQSGVTLEMTDGSRQIYLWGNDTYGQVSGISTMAGGSKTYPTRPLGTNTYTAWNALQLGNGYTLAVNPQ
jgi:alpha-tubulin suppressor-like RCC1 family protein